MKTYHLSKPISPRELYMALMADLSFQFNKKIKNGSRLTIDQKGNDIELSMPAPYEEYLYKVSIEGNNLNVSKSEHYTDDVYSLALEDVLMEVITDFIGIQNLQLVKPSAN